MAEMTLSGEENVGTGTQLFRQWVCQSKLLSRQKLGYFSTLD